MTLEIPGILDRRFPRRGFLQWGVSSALASLLNQSGQNLWAAEQTNPIRS